MPDIEERVIRLEERSDAHAREISALRTSVEALGISLRAEMSALETRLRAEILALRQEMDRRFMWLTGIMLTGFVALASAIGGLYWQFFQTTSRLQGQLLEMQRQLLQISNKLQGG